MESDLKREIYGIDDRRAAAETMASALRSAIPGQVHQTLEWAVASVRSGNELRVAPPRDSDDPHAMQPPLTHVEIRVLGALIEKAATTPDTYPLTLSALVAACNQLTNREPVMQLDEDAVTSAIMTMRRRSLLRAIQPAGSRVTKYQHLLDEALDLDARELAVLAVLMLRGPQTIGELHTRTARLATFDGLAAVEQVVEALLARDSGSLVTRLPRQPGQKEARYAQLLSGPVAELAPTVDRPAVAVAVTRDATDPAELAALQRRVQQLEGYLSALRAEFDAFRAAFG